MRTISNIFMSTLRAIAFLPMIIFMMIRDIVKGVKAAVIKGATLVRQIVCFPLNVVIYVMSAVCSALDRFVSPLFGGVFRWAGAKAEQAPTAEDLLKSASFNYWNSDAGSAKPCCSQCGQPGHNIRTCKKAPDGKSKDGGFPW